MQLRPMLSRFLKVSIRVLVYFFAVVVYAQELKSKDDNEYCIPSVAGLPRGKGLSVKYDVVPHYGISFKSKFQDPSTQQVEVSTNGRIELKAKVPIINKPSLALVGGLQYNQEQFKFENHENSLNLLVSNFDDRSLKSAGVSLNLIKPTRNNTYFLVRVKADLNGDFTSNAIPLSDFLKFSIAPMYGWKKNENLSYAVGIMYGYLFGRPSVYPLLSYNRNFSTRLGLESALPAFVKLRYSVHENSFWYFSTRVEGASYRLSNLLPNLAEANKPHLHRSGIITSVTYEHEILDWLWFGIEAGYRFNILFNVTNSPQRNAEVLIEGTVKPAPIAGVSLFVVAPKKK